MVENIFLQTPPPFFGMGLVGQNSTFSEHGNVAYQIKDNHERNNMVARKPPPPTTLGLGSVGKNSTFFRNGHISYQIKENQECSNKVANIVPIESPPLGWGQ